MAGVLEENRRKFAIALFIVGFGLILVGIILIINHQYYMREVRFYKETAAETNIPLAKTIQSVLFWVMVIVCIFSIGSLAMIRWSRRFRKQLLKKPAPPTPDEDVWAMHRLPEQDEDGNEYDSPAP